jgi:CheY-like chemotaxis protein
MRTPAAPPAAVRGMPAAPTEGPGGEPPLVLVVDDDVDARVLLGGLLDEAGCRAVGAATGVEGLRLARELHPVLIFLDLRLPKISGYDVLRILKADESLRDTPVIVVSAVASESRSALNGAAAVIDKPIDRDRLFEVLRRCLPTVAH